MNAVADGLIRLHDEILALRAGRCGLLEDLERETRNRRAEVSKTLAQFSKDFAAVARGTKADRQFILANIKRAVTGLRAEVRDDLGRVQQAFSELKAPLGDAFVGRTHLRTTEPSFSAEAQPEPREDVGERMEGKTGKAEGGRRTREDGKRKAPSRRRR